MLKINAMSGFGGGADVKLASMNWGNLTGAAAVFAVNPANAVGTTSQQQASGINKPVTLRGTYGGTLTSTHTLELLVNGTSIATANSGTFVEGSVSPDDLVSWRMSNTTDTGGDDFTGTITVTNETDGSAAVDTFNFRCYVEGTDVSVSPSPAWANISDSDASPTNNNVSTTAQAIQGTNVRITARITLTTTMSATRLVNALVNGSTVASGNSGTTLDVPNIAPGDTLAFNMQNTSDSAQTWSGTATVTNVSNANATLDTFTYSLAITGGPPVGATVTL